MKRLNAWLILASLPLLAWPFVLLAAALWLASLGNLTAFSARGAATILLAGSGQLLALAYPFVFVVSARGALDAKRRGDATAVWRLACRPFYALAATALLFLVWWLCDPGSPARSP